MYIAFFAGTIAGGLAVGVGLLMTVARDAGYLSLPEIVLWPVTGAAVFGAMFFVFDRFGWRWRGVRSAVGIPDISGTWLLEGVSYDQAPSRNGGGPGRLKSPRNMRRFSSACAQLRADRTVSRQLSSQKDAVTDSSTATGTSRSRESQTFRPISAIANFCLNPIFSRPRAAISTAAAASRTGL